MQIRHKKKADSKAPYLMVPVCSDGPKKLKYCDSKIQKLIDAALDAKEFKAKKEEIYSMITGHKDLPPTIILIGLGEQKAVTGSVVRNAYAKAVMQAKKYQYKACATLVNPQVAAFPQECVEGVQLGNYSLGGFQSGKSAAKHSKQKITEFHYLADKRDKDFEKQLQRGAILGEAVNFVRDLVNGPSNIVDEEYFAKQAKMVSKKSGAKIKVFERRDLIKMKMGALLGVNHGSAAGAKLITMEYKPRGAKGDPIILVGKGVLFDTGGYNLKPSAGIDTMHMDMAGAALVLGVISILKDLGIKRHVVGVTPVTQNMIDANAQRPNDIVTSYSGKTIQILNTDAEGRLILADALTYAQEKWKNPAAIIDFATLTGACMVALGNRYAGLFGNDSNLMNSIQQASAATDEEVWPLPIHDDYFEAMKDDMADLRNIDRGTSRLAGASKAAAFLKHFIEGNNKWAHLDIAGTAFVQKPKAYDYKYGTGYGVRMIANYLENLG